MLVGSGLALAWIAARSVEPRYRDLYRAIWLRHLWLLHLPLLAIPPSAGLSYAGPGVRVGIVLANAALAPWGLGRWWERWRGAFKDLAIPVRWSEYLATTLTGFVIWAAFLIFTGWLGVLILSANNPLGLW